LKNISDFHQENGLYIATTFSLGEAYAAKAMLGDRYDTLALEENPHALPHLAMPDLIPHRYILIAQKFSEHDD